MSNQEKITILVADDESVSRKYLKMILQKDGYEIITVENGEKCLETYQQIFPDMVLLDGLMPVMDGFDCCRRLKELPKGNDTIVLMITGLDDRDSVNQAYEAGATDFLTKPINPAVLRRRIKYLLDMKKAERALKESEEKYRTLVENLREVIFYADKKGNLTFLNPAWQELTGLPPHSCLGHPLSIYLYPEDQPIYAQYWHCLVNSSEDTTSKLKCQVRYVKKNGNFGWMRIFASLIINDKEELEGVTGTINDITERKRIEQYQIIERDVIKILAQSEQKTEAIQKILKVIGNNLGLEIGEYWELKTEDNLIYPEIRWHINNQEIEKILSIREENLNSILWEKWDFTYDEFWLNNHKLLSSKNEVNLRHIFAFPVCNGEEKLGIITFFSRKSTQYDINLLENIVNLGNQIGQFIKRKQAEEKLKETNSLLQSELSTASEYVFSLLPSPEEHNLSVEQKFIPSSKLGGDIFDYYWLDEENIAIYLLDVAGHGIHSALLSVSILNLVRNNSLYNTNPYQPWTIITELNRLFQMDSDRLNYFTIWYGVYNTDTHELIYSSAGHPPAILIYQEDNQWRYEKLKTPSLPVGMIEDVEFDQSLCLVKPDSYLYIFSDGIYEIEQENENIWGLENFISLLVDTQAKYKGELQHLIKQIEKVNHSSNFNDDLSILKIHLP
ncbi:SpoIIE family protein phosphatase [Cyanobacterium aponinum]|uniref:SpoIIE family protein phosphatase n=1 Tax=Cyanobacterium aponinum 0216 TaxID=2676140 RepID=A0A844GVQ9_9CHRO|nr:SpoIIE family protein phosphatase [Cyanobacterium aponinum]MTF38295.1 SpoIIE family protein phosphatase [Cyanobacterium aponinum 0216]